MSKSPPRPCPGKLKLCRDISPIVFGQECPPSFQGLVGPHCGHASWRSGTGTVPHFCKHFLWHRLPEGLMFQLGTDSSFSNLLLSNTTSMHSAQNLSICLNSSVPLTPHPVSHQVLRPNIPQCFPITSQPYAGVIVAHLNYAAGPSLLSLLPPPKSSCALYPKEKF